VLPKPNDAFAWVQATAGPALVCEALEPYAAHLFTTRAWPLGTAVDGDRAAAWTDVAHALGADGEHLIRLHQVHGASFVARKRGEIARKQLDNADIVVSDDPSLALAIQTADCVSLLIADLRTGAVGAAHAGWRGLAVGVPRVAVGALAETFGSRPSDLVVAIGPSISAPKYEVDEVVRAAFVAAGHSDGQLSRWFLDGTRRAHWQFDGWASARDQLEHAGVPLSQVHLSGLCTASHPDTLPSYRRDGKAAGRIAAAIRARR